MESNSDVVKDELKLWKGFADVSQVPPMIIETYIDLRSTNSRETVILKDENDHPWSVAKGGGKKHEVVLERWLIEFDRNDVSGSIIDELPLIYKQAIILFRSLYGFTRLMPAFKLKKLMNHTKTKKLPLGNKILDGKKPISSKGRIGLSKPIIPHQMLTTESHLTQKHFAPIQTTLGTLKVSVAYRNHYQFVVNDNEEILSNHFINMDSVSHLPVEQQQQEQQQELQDDPEQDPDSITGINDHDIYRESSHPDDDLDKSNTRSDNYTTTSMSVSPFSSKHSSSPPPGASGTAPKKVSVPHYSNQRPSIQPFKIGSISNSPPPVTGSFGGSSLERRISITSNKSASNASLAAMLRNPRSSTSSTTTSNIPIANSNSNNQYQSSFPRSVSSSHGQHDDNNPFTNPDNISNTPRFSSSFGSRASRRYSNTSIKHTSSVQDTIPNTSILGSLVGLTSSAVPLSGLYIDDDISDFVRMIDSKSDLRFSSYNHGSPSIGNSNANHSESKLLSNSSQQGSYSQLDALSKFQLLKSQHQQLGDSVSASLILQHNNTSSGGNSRPSSRKSSHSNYSSPSLPPGSYDKHMPSINSRLKEATPGSESISGSGSGSSQHNLDIDTYSNRSASSRKNSFHSNASFLKTSTTNKMSAAPVISTTTAHATSHKSSESPQDSSDSKTHKEGGVSGLATTPSTYLNRKHIYYENVFDDDDDDGEDYFLSHTNKNTLNPNSSKNPNYNAKDGQSDRKKQTSSSSRDIDSGEDEDDDLLFTMSDMNLTKQ